MALKRNGESRASPPRLYATDGFPGVDARSSLSLAPESQPERC